MKRSQFERKSYAMFRMAIAINRAIASRSGKMKERAARWAAAWGLICGIRSEGRKLRRNGLIDHARDHGSAAGASMGQMD